MKSKGAATIIATVLLVMMTVAAAAVSYTWTMKMQRDIQGDVEENQANQQSISDAKLFIASMWDDGGLNFTLQNTGTHTFADLTKFKIYSNGVPIASVPTYVPNTALTPGGATTVTPGIGFPAAGTSIIIKVVADTSTSITYMCKPNAGQSYC